MYCQIAVINYDVYFVFVAAILFENIYPKAYLYAINLKSLSTLNAQNYLVFSYPFLQLD